MVLPCFIGDRETGLERVAGPIAELEGEVWLVLNDGERRRASSRNVIDRLVALLANDRQRFLGSAGQDPAVRRAHI